MAWVKQVISVITTKPFNLANVELFCEIDEQWYFVGNKKINVGYGMIGMEILRALLHTHLEMEI